MAHEEVLAPHSQNGEGPARRQLPLTGKWLNSAILDVSHNRRFATPRVGITSAFGTFRTCRDFQIESAFAGKAEVGSRFRQGPLVAQNSGRERWRRPDAAPSTKGWAKSA